MTFDMMLISQRCPGLWWLMLSISRNCLRPGRHQMELLLQRVPQFCIHQRLYTLHDILA